MRDGEIDDVLRKAAEAQPTPDPALLARIAAAIQPKMAPVRPLPPAWVLSSALAGICVAIAVAAAARSGLHGIDAMDKVQKLVFPALAGFITAAAAAWVAEMIPGSKHKETPWKLLCSATFTFWALFPTLFRDHHTEDFVHSGVVCLGAGVMYAVPIALAGWWLLRRGFAVDKTQAALAAELSPDSAACRCSSCTAPISN